MTRSATSWVLYDVANSAFVLVIVTAVMPIFFKEIAARGIPGEVSTAWWGYANSFSSLLLAIIAPVLGACADYCGWKKRLFTLFWLIGCIATALLFFSREGGWFYCLAVFVVARTGWGGANVFYDAFITDISTSATIDKVSAAGYAWGYIGSIVPFLLVIFLFSSLQGEEGPDSIPMMAARTSFLIVAFWWFLLSLPMLRHVRQIHFIPPARHPVRTAMSRVTTTLSKLRQHRNPLLFLLAYFFFIDGVDTVMTMAVAYGVDLGIGYSSLILAILTIQVVAFPCTLIWGWLAKYVPVRTLLQAGIVIYVFITFVAFRLPSLPSIQQRTTIFWLLALLVATSMGGIQALSRSYYGRLIPPEHAGEFFSFFDVFGKFAAILGPFLVGITGQVAGESRYGVLSILLLLLCGSLLLACVREEELRI